MTPHMLFIRFVNHPVCDVDLAVCQTALFQEVLVLGMDFEYPVELFSGHRRLLINNPSGKVDDPVTAALNKHFLCELRVGLQCLCNF